ncbi:glycerol-3-phosphate dehydrogenase/oxidase [Rhodocaloribacter litoris]|uniref:glycerol-3-phosphate dehydrogenase/oxidase n=1 Tax=Rhodocaloribacter litoris TaxID=2558931 RepID=UPI001423D453|nr:glycerol-3-phosphate dehydrogenase/oxidase [Rhodocaloribacter litoris]QXD16109.1 glycerol-3-phosphate dehydrogenase/oxidase [Rhodocaloribacter litoris]
MNRDEMIKRIEENDDPWDMIIIGGGATGLGCAIEAASRGYRALLLEQHDFAKGTSSRSTKLVHGGVRYLRQGNIALVLEALRERGRLLKNAPHLVRHLPFVVPNYDWWEGPFYGIGLRLYDLLAGREGFGKSRNLSREETLRRLPTIEPEGLRGGVIYYDGQFDDARLAVNMAQTAVDLGGTVLNYLRVTGLVKEHDMVTGVTAEDVETERTYALRARVVINATGVFTDDIRRMDDPEAPPMIQPSQGVHLVLDRAFLPGETAIMVPETDDGRVLFAIPWHDRVVIGTTDTPVEAPSLEPRPLPEELDFLLTHAVRYLTKDPTPADVLSVFAGLRPLVHTGNDGTETAEISRDHTLHIARSGLVTITGGKWTTYRKMAEDTIDQAAVLAHLDERPCVTKTLHLHGWHVNTAAFGPLAEYGADAPGVQMVLKERAGWDTPLHPRLPYRRGEVVWAARHEMARTVEDVLARRTRALLLDARASIEAAPTVAALLAETLGRDEAWQARQIADYETLARGYLMP